MGQAERAENQDQLEEQILSLAPSRSVRRRLFLDRASRSVFTLGAFFIIGSILAILIVILAEVIPLFRPATATRISQIPAPTQGDPVFVTVDEYLEVGVALGRDGVLRFLSFGQGHQNNAAFSPEPILTTGESISVGAKVSPTGYVVATQNGEIIPFQIRFDADFTAATRIIRPKVTVEEPFKLTASPQKTDHIAAAKRSDGLVVATASAKTVAIFERTVTESLTGETQSADKLRRVELPDTVTALLLTQSRRSLLVATRSGAVFEMNLTETEPKPTKVIQKQGGGVIVAATFLSGEKTLITGDDQGNVESWMVRKLPKAAGTSFVALHKFHRHKSPVRSIVASTRNKGFVSVDEHGEVALHYHTSVKTLLVIESALRNPALAFSPRSDGILVGGEGKASLWGITNPHPEVSFDTLFNKVQYEGYDKPEYVWQSTGGTDQAEPKLSVTPLLFGTLKGTFYALLFAVPLALLGALYTSQFLNPRYRAFIKPAVEFMAALPSVVVGFFAGLWLAPYLEHIVVAVFFLPITIVVSVTVVYLSWKFLRKRYLSLRHPAIEILGILGATTFGMFLAIYLNTAIESSLFGGDFKHWLFEYFQTRYDQRNSIVVGIAMGFAVIPIIFTIAEDCLSNVPRHLVAGSLALGATRWQTAIRVVLPTASPGIFSAVMIGFGRAVGETMIVLMATGNTPVLDTSIFNGFRALSANIAVELPESSVDGTLFRVLFFTALLLFIMTFILNTLSELVRNRLRRRYKQV